MAIIAYFGMTEWLKHYVVGKIGFEFGYVIVRADSRDQEPESDETNNLITSAISWASDVEELSLNVPMAFALGANQYTYYKLKVPVGKTLNIQLGSSTSSSANELYLSVDQIPTRSIYYYAAASANQPNPALTFSTQKETYYYMLVHRSHLPAGQANTCTLTATLPNFAVNSLSIDSGSNTGYVTTVINGFELTPDISAELIGPGGVRRVASDVWWRDSTEIWARFDLMGLPVPELGGTFDYDLMLTSGTASTMLPGAFAISDGRNDPVNELSLSINVPSATRGRGGNLVTVNYTNSGKTDLDASLLLLQANIPVVVSQPSVLGSLGGRRGGGTSRTAPVQVVMKPVASAPLYFAHSNTGLAGILPPGASGSFSYNFALADQSAPPHSRLYFTVSTLDLSVPIDWATLEGQAKPDYIQPAAWSAMWSNLAQGVGPTWGHLQRALADNATHLSLLGQKITAWGYDQLLGFEYSQANNSLFGGPLDSALDIYDPAPGLPLTFGRVFPATITGRQTLGLLGHGWSHEWDIRVLQGGTTDDDRLIMHVVGPNGVRTFTQEDQVNYQASPGDTGQFSLVSNKWILKERNGLTYTFNFNGYGVPSALESVADNNGNTITLAYSGGLLTQLTHSNSNTLTISYQGVPYRGTLLSLISQVQDATGRTASYSYDNNGHLTSVTRSDGTCLYRYSPDASGPNQRALTRTETPDGSVQTFAFDSMGRIMRVGSTENPDQDALFNYGSTGIVYMNRIPASTPPNQIPMLIPEYTFYPDDRGQISRIIDPNLRVSQAQYDHNGQLINQILPNGARLDYVYDPAGHLTGSQDAQGQWLDFDYDPVSHHLTGVTDQRGNLTDYQYDNQGNLTAIVYADGSAEQFAYDVLGNLTSSTNRRGQVINYTYNTDGLVTQKDYEDGSADVFTYDARGNMLTATDPSGTTTMEYNAADPDLMTKISYPNGRFLQYTYDNFGRRTRMEDQDGFVTTYTYDSAGRLHILADSAGSPIVTYTYDPDGRLSREDKGNGTYTTYNYDQAGQLLNLVNYAPNGSVNSRFDYTCDAVGQRIAMSTLEGDWTYLYDATGQLTRAVFASNDPTTVPNQDLTYVYDPAGNRIQTIINGTTTDYSTNNLNQYGTVGTASYQYDAAGNLIGKTDGTDTWSYTYDDQNRLVGVVTPTGTWQYEYDIFGQRIATVKDGVRTEYLVDPFGFGNVVGEYDASGSALANYSHGIGLEGSYGPAGPVSYYDFDALGSTAGLSGSAGNYLNRYSYLPFGEELTNVETANNSFEFVGQWGVMNEGNGLDFMRARFYDEGDGRFVNPDPIGQIGDSSLYEYVSNSPNTRTDPIGLLQIVFTYTTFVGAGGSISAIISETGLYVRLSPGFGIGKGGSVGVAKGTPKAGWANAFVSGNGAVGPFGVVMRFNDGHVSWETKSFEGLRVEASFTGNFTFRILKNPFYPPPPGPNSITGNIEVFYSWDPNDIIGPQGFGPENWIAGPDELGYTIRFENDPQKATASAQTVQITQQLDDDLDYGTFRLGDFGFGNFFVDVPDGVTNYEVSLDVVDTLGVFVDVKAGIDLATGQVFWEFISIDPATGDLTSDPFSGFLPPNHNSPEGEGWVTYTVSPKPMTQSGTRIDAEASIVFDINAAINTPPILNTFDIAGPTSWVDPLPAQVTTTDFAVSWSGQDDTNGSGIASYDIYVSDNGGPFELWLDDTTETSAVFNGQASHTYAFYSIATDNVGHTEAAPAAPDTQTQVVLPNNAPVANADTATMPEDTTLNIAAPGMLGNDSDSEGDPLTAILDTDVTNGTLTLNADGSFTYVPNPDFNGTDSFTYYANDGLVDSNVATVTITVNAVNDPPVIEDVTFSVDENAPSGTEIGQVIATDPEDNIAGYDIILGNEDGVFAMDADGDGKLGLADTGRLNYEEQVQYVLTVQVIDSEGLTDTAIITVNVDDINEAELGDWVWHDTNGNGIQDAQESGMAGVTVNLYDTAQALVDSTVTDADGFYQFVEVPGAAQYYLEFIAPADYVFTDANQGIDDTVDSDADQNGLTETFGLGTDDDLSWDAGLIELGSIAGLVWHDLNEDDQPDQGEPALSGWTVFIDDNGGTTVQTDANGLYVFENLRPGSYVITVDVPEGWMQLYPNQDVSINTYTGSSVELALPGTSIVATATTEAGNLVGLDDLQTDGRFAGIDGSGQSIVIIDTGIDLDHPAFGPDNNGDGVADRIVYQYDFADQDADASDVNGHGSHVASIVAAEDGSSTGLAPGVDLIILKVFSDDGTGYFSYVEQALGWVIDHVDEYNIVAVNMSFGDEANWAQSAGHYGIADELTTLAGMNVICVGAAGNGFARFDSDPGLAYPAADPNVISVGAVWDGDHGGPWNFSGGATDYTTDADRVISFSQRDDWLDIFGPGALIAGADDVGGTMVMRGTSQATPHVAGAAVLAQQIAMAQLGRYLTIGEFRHVLDNAGVIIIDGDDENDNVINTDLSYMRLDVYNLAEAILNYDPATYSPGDTDEDPSSQGPDAGSLVRDDQHAAHTVLLASGQHITDINFGMTELNRAPTANDDTYDINEDTTLTVTATGILGNDSDIDADFLTAVQDSGTANGTLTLNSDGSFSYTPNANFNGTDSFTYHANDGLLDSNIATVTITINAVNDAPVAIDDAYATNEDTLLNVAAPGVLANDSDVDGDPLTALLNTDVSNGTLTLNADGSFSYTPDPDFNGVDSFTYTADDGKGGTDTATVTVNVGAVNDPPVANDDTASTAEDTATTIDVLANDIDKDGDPLSVASVTQAANGAVTNNGTDVTYTPNADFNGSDSFTYTASDGNGGSHTANVTITVTPVNDVPVAVDDTYSTNEDTSLNVAAPGVLSNDSDADGDTLSAVLASGVSNGTLTLNADGSFSYTPDPNFNGSDSFTYVANDGLLDSNVATVAITINAVNDAPVVVDDAYTTNEDTSLNVGAPGVLGNDSDQDGHPLTAILDTDVTNGTLTLNPDGSFSYTPNANFNGTDSFTYHTNDGIADSNIATVTITITAVNDAPVATDDSATTPEDTAVTVDVLFNDTDVDGDPLTVASITQGANGTVTINPAQAVTYAPNANFNGTDSFTYTIDDSNGGTDTATVTVNVGAVNDPAIANDDTASTTEDTAVTIDVLANDTDTDGDTLSVVSVTEAANGTVTNNGMDVTYAPNADFNGIDNFTYTVNDGNGGSDTATVTITIASVNDASVAANDEYSVNEDNTLTVVTPGVLGNDSDVDGDVLEAVLVEESAHGTVSVDEDGSFSYTPHQDYFGLDSFTYRAGDRQAESNEATVTISVRPINDAPVAADDTFGVDEDAILHISAPGVLANDGDVDGDVLTMLVGSGDASAVFQTFILEGLALSFVPEALEIWVDGVRWRPVESLEGRGESERVYTVGVDEEGRSIVRFGDGETGSRLPTGEGNVVATYRRGAGHKRDNLMASVASLPSRGILVLDLSGSFTYTPDANFNGTDSFTYTVDDGTEDSNIATVTITVNPVNDPPVANDDTATTDEDIPVIIDVLANDNDIDGDTLSVASVSDPANGTAVVNLDGTVSYTPNAGFTGTDSFTYTVDDGNGGTDTATVTITVNDTSEPPMVIDDLSARAKDGKVQLTWTDTGADHYNVYRSTTAGGPYTLVASTTSTYSTYLDADVVTGTTYYYVVRPVLANGDELGQSNEASATPIARVRRRR